MAGINWVLRIMVYMYICIYKLNIFSNTIFFGNLILIGQFVWQLYAKVLRSE